MWGNNSIGGNSSNNSSHNRCSGPDQNSPTLFFLSITLLSPHCKTMNEGTASITQRLRWLTDLYCFHPDESSQCPRDNQVETILGPLHVKYLAFICAVIKGIFSGCLSACLRLSLFLNWQFSNPTLSKMQTFKPELVLHSLPTNSKYNVYYSLL